MEAGPFHQLAALTQLIIIAEHQCDVQMCLLHCNSSPGAML